MKKILSIIIALVLTFSLFGCNKTEGTFTGGAIALGTDSNGNKITVKKGTISINVYAAGYGTGWIDSAVENFNKLYPGITVKVEASPLALSAVQTMLENKNCTYDLVLVASANYNSFVGKGYLEDLSDLYNSTIPGTDKIFKDCVIEDLVEKYTVNEKIYGVSWQPNYPSGLVYNLDLFEEYGWEIPETMDEFFELCEQIDVDTDGSVTPLTFGGADGNGYLFTVLPQWLLECYGVEGYSKFLDLESPQAYQDQAEGRDKIYKTLAKLTKGKLKSGNDITLEGSVGATAITAQTNFIQGRCAMIINGTWFPIEMQEYIELRNFKVGYMPIPHINSDKKSIDGTIDTSNVRYSSDNGVFAIPSTSKNKELAKAFLGSMMTEESYTGFVENCCGLNRFFKNIDVDTTNFDTFTKSAYEYFNANGNEQVCMKFSRNKVIETSVLEIFFAYKGGFFEKIAGAKTYNDALTIASGCVSNELDEVNQKWDASKKEWKQ